MVPLLPHPSFYSLILVLDDLVLRVLHQSGVVRVTIGNWW